MRSQKKMFNPMRTDILGELHMSKHFFILMISCLLLWLALPFTVRAAGVEYNVTNAEFGANGKDKNDDRDAIQSALNKAKETNNHITVVIPSGTYYLSEKPLHVFSNTTIKADGATFIHTGKNTEMLVNWPEVEPKPGGYDCSTNITVQGGTWDGNASTKEACNLFTFTHANNITISGVTMKNCCGNHFIEFSAVKDSTIINSTFRDFKKVSGVNYSIADAASTENSDDSNNEASITAEAIQLDYAIRENSMGAAPFDGTSCRGIKVTGCKFIKCLSGIGNHHNEKSSSDWTFTNNTFSNMGYACFNVENTDNVTISGNTATDSLCFIELRDIKAKNVVITNNKITHSKGSNYVGIKLTDTKGISVTKNTVSGYKYGMLILTSDAEVSGNTVSNCDLFGIRFTEYSNSSKGIKNNIVSNIKESGIGVKDFKGNITGNTTTKFGYYGIKVSGKCSGIIENNIYDKSFSIYNTGNMTKKSNIYKKNGKTVAEPDYYTIYYHKDDKDKSLTKKTVAKYNEKTRSLTAQELGFSVKGKRFAGWKAYRSDMMQWRVVDKKGNDTWSETLPSGYSYYVYREAHNFEKAAEKGAEIHLYGIWESVGNGKLEVLDVQLESTKISKDTKQYFYVTTEKNAKYLFVISGVNAKGQDNIVKTWDAATYSTVKNGKRVWNDIKMTMPTAGNIVFWFRTGTKIDKPVSNKYFVFFEVISGKVSNNWGKPTYTWSKDLSTVTAKRVNKKDKSYVDTEIVATMRKVTKKPSVTEKGELTYTTVSFQNKAFKKQTRTFKIPKIKSTYKDSTGTYTIKTDTKSKEMYAIYNGPASKSVKTVTIPTSITVSDVKIIVKGIGAKAFKDCSKLQTIKIETIWLRYNDIDKNAFNGMPANVIIKCNKSVLKTYQARFVLKGVKNAKSIKAF